MQPSNIVKAGLFAAIIALIVVISWEIHLRHKGFNIIYDDNEALFADKRAMANQSSGQVTVFIGASRIKYDLNIPLWNELTGNHAVQLANVGSNPRLVLRDLANDPDFKGNLVIDVTEGIFFSEGAFYDSKTRKKIAYYHDQTPTQRFSFQVDHFLESQLVFLDQDHFSFNAMIDDLRPVPRPGVFPGLYFPFGFTPSSFERESFMTPEFAADTNQHNTVKAVWSYGLSRKNPPMPKEKMDSIFLSVKQDIDKIKSRGGQVIFIRPPSSGMFWEVEQKGFPRTAYWDRLLTYTGCQGIHFKDNPTTANMICPEWSHLAPSDVVIYTKELIAGLQEKGWSFNKKPGT